MAHSAQDRGAVAFTMLLGRRDVPSAEREMLASAAAGLTFVGAGGEADARSRRQPPGT